MRWLVALVVGVAAGLAIGLALTSPVDPPPLASATRLPPQPSLPSLRAVDLPCSCEDQIHGLEAEKRALEQEAGALRAQLALYGGTPVDWPETLSADFRQPAIEAWLGDAVQKTGVEAQIIEIDCSEFPCIALFRYDSGAPSSSAVVAPLRDAFVERGGAASTHVVGTEAGAYAAMIFAPSETPDNAPAGSRTSIRVQDLVTAHLP